MKLYKLNPSNAITSRLIIHHWSRLSTIEMIIIRKKQLDYTVNLHQIFWWISLCSLKSMVNPFLFLAQLANKTILFSQHRALATWRRNNASSRSMKLFFNSLSGEPVQDILLRCTDPSAWVSLYESFLRVHQSWVTPSPRTSFHLSQSPFRVWIQDQNGLARQKNCCIACGRAMQASTDLGYKDTPLDSRCSENRAHIRSCEVGFRIS